MKGIFKKIAKYYIDIYIIINILYITIGSYYAKIDNNNFESYSKVLIFLLVVNIITIIFLFILKKYKYHKADICIAFILLFCIISTIFAYNREVALFGTRFRYEGLFSIAYYLSIMFLSSFSKNKKNIVYFILLSGLINLAYAWCQRQELYDVKTITHLGERWATGFAINPNFFGTFMLLCLSFSIGLLIDENRIISKIIFGVLTILFTTGIMLSNALSCFVGMIVVFIFSSIYLIISKRFVLITIILSLIVLTTIEMVNFNQTSLLNDYVNHQKEISDISKGYWHDSYGSDRVYLWRAIQRKVPENLLHGIGIDNVFYINDGQPIRRWYITYDKAHCEYLQLLITGGIFYLISYLSLYFIIIKNGIKDCFKKKEIYLLLPVIGYLVQATFNISVIEVAPFFYISLGLLINRNAQNKRGKK